MRPLEARRVGRWHSSFSADEREALAALPQDQRDAAFIAAWTMKEAVGKADGRGIRAQASIRPALLRAWFNEADKRNLYRNGKLDRLSDWRFSVRHPDFALRLALAAKHNLRNLRFLIPGSRAGLRLFDSRGLLNCKPLWNLAG